MRGALALLSLSLILAAASIGQQPQAQPAPAQKAPSQEAPLVIYRVDLEPSGSAFAMNEPVLEGDTWVFRTIPDREVPEEKGGQRDR